MDENESSAAATKLSETIIDTITELIKEYRDSGGKQIHPAVTTRLQSTLAKAIDRSLITAEIEEPEVPNVLTPEEEQIRQAVFNKE